MILSCHDSVAASFGQRGELNDMSVQIDPLNNFQPRVIQQALQMIPHRASAPRFGGNCKPGILVPMLMGGTPYGPAVTGALPAFRISVVLRTELRVKIG